MEVKVIEAPTPWVQPTGDEFDKERKEFLEGFTEVLAVNDDYDSVEPDAPF